MEPWPWIRRRVLVEGVRTRQVQVLRGTGLQSRTLKRVLHHSEPPGYRQSAPSAKKKLGPILGVWNKSSGQGPAKKKGDTAQRIFERLQAEGYTGRYTLDGMTHRVHLLGIKGACYRLKSSKKRVRGG